MADLDRINIFDYQAPTPEELLRAGGSGSRIEPISAYDQFQIARSQPSTDPVIRRLQQIGKGIESFLVPQTTMDAVFAGILPAKAAQTAVKGIQSLPKTKDLVFVHNTSEEAIKSFDAMGGIPSPSIAVTKADQPFTGFGDIQLIGKPEKFDPAVNPANKVYSADAYTPRAPQKIRLAKEGAAERFLKDYKEFEDQNEVRETAQLLKNLEEKTNIKNSYDYINEFMLSDNVIRPSVKAKFLKDKGLNPEDYSLANDNRKDFPYDEWKKWLTKEKDKYLSQDGVFEYFDEFDETTKYLPYTLKNVVDNMVVETQRGGEALADKFSTVGPNRLRALMSEEFKDLPDIRARKEMIVGKESLIDMDIGDDIANILDKATDPELDISKYTMPRFMADDVVNYIGESLKIGRRDLEKIAEDAFKYHNLHIGSQKQFDDAVKDVANAVRLNAMRPVQYFEAKPTRAVGFDEFAGAIVPEGTSKEVIDILEKRGLKVVTKNVFEDIGSNKARQQFQDQFFSIGLPATGATALGIQNIDIFKNDTE